MYDITVLEKQWKQYNRNKKKPYLITSIIFVSVVAGVFSFLKYNDNVVVKQLSLKKPKMSETIAVEQSSILLDGALSTVQINKKEILETIKPIVKMEVEDSSVEQMPTLPIVDDIPVLEEDSTSNVVRKQPKIVKVDNPIREKPRKKMHLNIIESSSVSAYKDVEKRFYESHDTDDSLFLAKSYYRKGNYKKSEYWSLQTNKINSNIEESWMIFVQSKIKLGHTNEAIRILTNYVKRSNSNAANSLLVKLKKNN